MHLCFFASVSHPLLQSLVDIPPLPTFASKYLCYSPSLTLYCDWTRPVSQPKGAEFAYSYATSQSTDTARLAGPALCPPAFKSSETTDWRTALSISTLAVIPSLAEAGTALGDCCMPHRASLDKLRAPPEISYPHLARPNFETFAQA